MQYHERKPRFNCCQFTGTTDSLRGMLHAIKGLDKDWTITSHNGTVQLRVGHGGIGYTLNEGDWLVQPDSGGAVEFVSEAAFRARFEPVHDRYTVAQQMQSVHQKFAMPSDTATNQATSTAGAQLANDLHQYVAQNIGSKTRGLG